jgi:hypothetical protein
VDLRHRTLTQVESIDPIARDLELKIQQQEKDDTLKFIEKFNKNIKYSN